MKKCCSRRDDAEDNDSPFLNTFAGWDAASLYQKMSILLKVGLLLPFDEVQSHPQGQGQGQGQ
jgi:hypothetical protein